MREVDLLYTDSEHLYKKCDVMDNRVFDDLKLFRLIESCANARRHSYRYGSEMEEELRITYKALSSPCAVGRDITYRQQIFASLLSKPGLAVAIASALSGSAALERTRQSYDHLDNAGKECPYIRTLNYLFFLSGYKRFVLNLHDALAAVPREEGKGLHDFFAALEEERVFVESDAFNAPQAEFKAFYSDKLRITGELTLRSSNFNELSFDFDESKITASYQTYDFIEALDSAERALGLAPEASAFSKKSEVTVIRPYHTFEKRLITKIFNDPEIIPEGRGRLTALTAEIKALHDSIDPAPFALAYSQMRFYKNVCSMIEYLSARVANKFNFAERAESGRALELRGIFDPVIALQKIQAAGDRSPADGPYINDIQGNGLSVGDKRVFVITGPNNGGKTAFARAAAICLIFHAAGAPIPADSGVIPTGLVPDTHFTADETHKEGSGRLAHELHRLEELYQTANERRFLILNETFAGTNPQRALELFYEHSARIAAIPAYALYVTHFHNIAIAVEEGQARGESAFAPCENLIAQMDAGGTRTFRVLPMRPSDTSFAADVVRRFKLSWEQMEEGLGLGRAAPLRGNGELKMDNG